MKQIHLRWSCLREKKNLQNRAFASSGARQCQKASMVRAQRPGVQNRTGKLPSPPAGKPQAEAYHTAAMSEQKTPGSPLGCHER